LAGFYGQFQTTLDDKGRFALPAKLRNIYGPAGRPLLDGNLVLTKGLDGCLALYPELEWADIQKRLSSLSFTNKNFRFFSRMFYSMASPVIPDRSGRILIPAYLIKEAELNKELLVLGVNKWVEIWNPQNFEKHRKEQGMTYEDVAERLFAVDGSE
jgi:MraZ protein